MGLGRRTRAALALMLASTLFTSSASAATMLTLDPTIGVGGALRGEAVRAHYGLYASLLFGPRADETAWTFPVGVYLSAGGDSKGNGVGSIGVTVAALGAPSATWTPFVLSAGVLGVERDDGRTHPGALVHASWGVWGPDDFVYKAISASLFVDVRALFPSAGLPAEQQVVAGIQVNPVALIAGLAVGAFAAGNPHNHL